MMRRVYNLYVQNKCTYQKTPKLYEIRCKLIEKVMAYFNEIPPSHFHFYTIERTKKDLFCNGRGSEMFFSSFIAAIFLFVCFTLLFSVDF